MNNKQAEREAFFDFYKSEKEKDLFSDQEQYQVYNIYRHPDRPKAEKVLRTFGDKRHCDEYVKKYGNYLTIEPYNADEWQRPKLNGCCILPLEKFEEEEK